MPFSSLFYGKDLLSYVEAFKTRVTFPIVTPDGFTISCLDIEEGARHICCGKEKSNPVQLGRAQRILWLNDILMDVSLRKVILQHPTGNVIFFCEEKKYIIICSEPVKGSRELRLISAYPISGALFVSMRELKKPHKLYT